MSYVHHHALTKPIAMADERTPLLLNTDSSSTTIPKHPHLGKTDIHTQFIALVGVPASNVPTTTKPTTTWPKSSLYGRATRQLRSQSFTYQFTAALSNTLLLSQVVLGAAVTGLGASASSHIIITVIGALNTVIAGLVAYLKSRGQPMRARMYRDDLERVVDEIENSEVMFLGISNGVQGYEDVVADGDVTVRSEVARLTRLYERAVRNNTANNPDSYVQGPGMDGLGGGAPRGVVPLPPAPVVVAAPSPPNPNASTPTVAAPAAVPAVVVSQDPDASPASAPLKRPDTPKPSESTTTPAPPVVLAAPAAPSPAPQQASPGLATNDEAPANDNHGDKQDDTKPSGQAQAGAPATQPSSDSAPAAAQPSPQAPPVLQSPTVQAPSTITSAPSAPPTDSAQPPARDPDESPASAPLRRRHTPATLPTTSTLGLSNTNASPEAKINGEKTKQPEATKSVAGQAQNGGDEKEKENVTT